MIEKLDSIGNRAIEAIQGADTLEKLENIRVSFLGKKGELSQVLRGMVSLSADERPKVGSLANEWKKKIENTINGRRSSLEGEAIASKIANERIDVTLPARQEHRGAIHPLTATTRKIVDVLARVGFDVTTGPEIDTEFLTFDAINIPADHPARDMQDTFFMGPGVVLRTHTSPVQMRTMLSKKWPVRVLCPGAVYRCDNDATHSPMFHQIEGLWVDRDVKMSDLKGVLEFFAKELFGAETKIRMRPSYFPFVEPGAEVDVTCFKCGGKGCGLCKQTGWIEILGAGMVHPHLFKVAGYKSEEVSGFAFGVGVERVAMLLHHISDIRLFYQGDLRLLRQFS